MTGQSKQSGFTVGGATRREFIRMGAGATLALSTAASYARIIGANEKVRLGFIGLGNRGESLLKEVLVNCPSVQVAALCDVYQPYLDHAKAQVDSSVPAYSDYRALLEHSDVDAVVIATPDHWHALQFIHASDAGKDIYVEKPLSLVVGEGRSMVRAAEKNRTVAQMGAQRHSTPYIVEACRLIREGAIGKVTHVRCFHVVNEFPMGIGRRVSTPPPAGLNWDMWLGPAPYTDFQEMIWNYKFRWFWNYSGGQITNNGTHWIDVIQMALDQDAPQSVAALGGKFAVEDDREIPDTMEVIWRYKDCLVTFSQINSNAALPGKDNAEIIFRGTAGTLYIYSNRYVIETEEMQDGPYPSRGPLNRKAEPPRRTGATPVSVPGKVDHAGHINNFLECVKTRTKCACDVETGHRSSTTSFLANIALRTGALLNWDRTSETFTNSDEANHLLTYPYRSPWILPYA